MKRSTFEQFAIVREDSASLFSERLNETIYRLKDNNPTVHFSESDPLCAYVNYSITETTPETISEEIQMGGASFVCAQCPYFHAVLKDDGEPDRRCKWGECEYAELGRTYTKSAACDKLYKLIKEGDVRLCFRD